MAGGSDGVLHSDVRFDRDVAYAVDWEESTDNEATFVKSPGSFLDELHRAETMFVRIRNFNGESNDAEFQVMGLTDAMNEHPQLCK